MADVAALTITTLGTLHGCYVCVCVWSYEQVIDACICSAVVCGLHAESHLG